MPRRVPKTASPAVALEVLRVALLPEWKPMLLPSPTEAELEAFETEARPDASKSLMDGLLVLPVNGGCSARQGRDAHCFGETHGCDGDLLRGHAWPV